MTPIPAIVCLLFLAVLLVGEYKQHFLLRAVSKTLASLAFVVQAPIAGAMDVGPAGIAIMVALVLSALGDVLLLWRDKGPFLAGILAFLGGHIAYGVGFVLLGVDPVGVGLAAVPLLLVAALAWRLFGTRAGDLAPAVGVYILVISIMVGLAGGSAWVDLSPPRIALLLAAVMFFVSDLAVARDRFVEPGFANRIVGLPLYYSAQLVFALAIGLVGT